MVADIKLKSPLARGQFEIKQKFQVITPVFGGGVWIDPNNPHLKEHDQTTPIRSAALRGQLRFWWRATHGTAQTTLTQMRQREDIIWGNASQKGKVSVAVTQNCTSTRTKRVFEFNKGYLRALRDEKALAYGAFPLQPSSKAQKESNPQCGELSIFDGIAELKLVGPKEYEADVRDALDAWLAFGGVGGRTRRGFGAVAGVDHTPNPQELIERWSALTPIDGVTSLAQSRLILGNAKPTPDKALKSCLDALMTFRQSRTGDGGRGRSKWPEPDAIRKLTGQADPRHRPNPATPKDKFPRGAFGMPIIFHFKDSKDPDDAQLQPKGKERRASRLIIRPFTNPQGKHQPMALLMTAPQTDKEDVVLQHAKDQHPVSIDLTPDEAARIRPLEGQTDVLGRFLTYFKTQTSR